MSSKQEKLNDEKIVSRKSVKAALQSFTTVKRLLDAWPEVAPFIPPKPTPAQLPAIPTQQLNKALGLPVGEAA